MLNYANLNDVEFEALCLDIMQKKLNVELSRFSAGQDQGIDLCDDVRTKHIVIQVKHYVNSSISQLLASLKRELAKVEKLNPGQYFICCSKPLSPQQVDNIYAMFSKYMDSSRNVVTIHDIDTFLNDPINIDVLEKHYKLWIESTGILQNIINGDIFVDCETLLSTIEDEKTLFVQTRAYEQSIELLEHGKSLFIVGNPGVGKTITSKMLVLYFAAHGYRVRYTTNTSDLQVLKRALSRDRDTKEIVLVDDCFGQAYFNMRETQSNELIALIKFVRMCRNKLLILNSRVTIYKEARQISYDLVRCLDNGECQVYTIDMDSLTLYEKARIFYNHLVYHGIPDEYLNEIRKDQRYLRIVKHKNYNPRLIEFVCSRKRQAVIPAEKYYDFISSNLNNPAEMWRDEYVNRLQKPDRILLSTIYSFSDLGTSLNSVKFSFEHRIAHEANVDTTINQFEQSLNRLLEGFVVITDRASEKTISMANPSVNDFLNGYYNGNQSGKQELLTNITHVEQAMHLLKGDAYRDWSITAVRNHNVDRLMFRDKKQRSAFVTYAIALGTILDNEYRSAVDYFIFHHADITYGSSVFNDEESVFRSLFNNKSVLEFYGILKCLYIEYYLDSFLDDFSLDCLILIVTLLSPHFERENRDFFVATSLEHLKSEIDAYCSEIAASDLDVDIRNAIQEAEYETPYGTEVNRLEAEKSVEETIKESIVEELSQKIIELPGELSTINDYLKEVDIQVYGIDALVDSYLDADDWHEPYIPRDSTQDKEIIMMFQKRI